MVWRLVLPFLAALSLSVALTPLVRLLAIRFGRTAQPSAERWHKKNTPTLGGVAIFLSVLISYAIFSRHGWAFLALTVCSVAALTMGLVDDWFHITPNSKLIGQIMVASILVNFGYHFNAPISAYLNIPLTILWVVGIMNAFNLLDNMDGLCAGISFIAAASMLIYSILNYNLELGVISAVLAGATLGFLRYNFNPARIFMGDCGSMFLGFVFAALALIGTQKEASSLIYIILIPSLILAVPIFDTIFVAFTRQMNARPVYLGGKDHTSHRLVALGLSEKRAVLMLYFIAMICGGGAVLYYMVDRMIVLILSSIVAIGLLLFGMFLGGVKVYSDDTVPMKNIKKKAPDGVPVILNGFVYNKRRIVEVVIDFITICIAYTSAYLLRFEGVISPENQQLLLTSLSIIIPIKLLMFFAFGVYRGIWKYVGLHDAIAIAKGVTAGSVLSVIALVFLFRFEGYSRALFIIDWMILLLLASGVRAALRLFREFFAMHSTRSKRVFIVGAGDAGELLLREIRHNKNLDYVTVGFLDDDIKKAGKLIHGVPVFGTTRHLAALCRKNRIEELLIAIPSVSERELAAIFDKCHKYKINFKHISSIMGIR